MFSKPKSFVDSISSRGDIQCRFHKTVKNSDSEKQNLPRGVVSMRTTM